MPDPAPLAQRLKDRFPEAVLAVHAFRGDETAVIEPGSLLEIARFLRDDPAMAFNFLMDATAVDYLRYPRDRKDPPGPSARFEVIYHFYSLEQNHRLRVKIPVKEADPVVDSLAGLWASADWYEREIWDMFGIKFRGHPNLKRLLMYEEFEGYPLRKDYAVTKRQPLIGPVN